MTYARFLDYALVLGCSLALACGDPGPADDTDASDNPVVDAGNADAGPPPTFETNIVPILENSCGAGNNMCHARVAYAANAAENCRGWLSLENVPLGAEYYDGAMVGQPTGCPDMPLYERLVELDAWQCEAFDPRQRYVVPCRPDQSYLLRKIGGGPYCRDGNGDVTQAMPPTMVLDPALVAIIERWIAAGAPRDGEELPDCNMMNVNAPVAEITHPGDGEVRQAGVAFPFIGNASDVEDGQLGGDSLVWTSDRDGQIGVGLEFNASLTAGVHVITLTATDSDGNEGTDSLTLDMVE